jgi:hypothetical protein
MKFIKRSSLLMVLFICLAKFGWGQTYYSVAELKNHIGKTVNVMDSVYSGQFFQKSVAVLSLGNPKKSDPLTLIIYGTFAVNTPKQYLHTYQTGKISFRGMALMSDKGLIVVLEDRSSLRFEALGKI